MSKEETVYVENHLGMSIMVKVKRGSDRDIEVYLDMPDKEGEIVNGGGKSFSVPAGDD